MNDRHDVNKLIAESKAKNATDANGIPILGQQVPVLHGLPVNGGIMTVEAIRKLSEDQFRELFVAVIVSMMGGVYVPPQPSALKVDVEKGTAETSSEDQNETVEDSGSEALDSEEVDSESEE